MKKAHYTFSVYSFGIIHHHTVTVTIVDETPKQYKIRIPCSIGSHAPNDTMWVRRKSLRLLDEQDDPVPAAPATTQPPARQYDYSNEFWNQ